MECKFIHHGMSISYDHVVKPCCHWELDQDWKQIHHISKADLTTWHTHPDLIDKQNQLIADHWPSNCKECNLAESQGRGDSGRGNSNYAYKHYQADDITLEIRPGSVCNFACQTCWPEASSRVAQFHSQAGLIDIKNINSTSIDNFDFLLPVAKRIRDVVLLGGEPFYDKSCKKFLAWAQEHLTANITMFTNGSMLDLDFLKKYAGQVTLVFSLDAVGKPAEYIRLGTVWDDVIANYKLAKQFTNVRINITCSPYNYHHIKSIIDLLVDDWPECVTFGTPTSNKFQESIIPMHIRPSIIKSLRDASISILQANIETSQKQNALNAIRDIILKLSNNHWDQTGHAEFCKHVNAMDRVKKVYAQDYCDILNEILIYQPN